jgi:hypothetical protein
MDSRAGRFPPPGHRGDQQPSMALSDPTNSHSGPLIMEGWDRREVTWPEVAGAAPDPTGPVVRWTPCRPRRPCRHRPPTPPGAGCWRAATAATSSPARPRGRRTRSPTGCSACRPRSRRVPSRWWRCGVRPPPPFAPGSPRLDCPGRRPSWPGGRDLGERGHRPGLVRRRAAPLGRGPDRGARAPEALRHGSAVTLPAPAPGLPVDRLRVVPQTPGRRRPGAEL